MIPSNKMSKNSKSKYSSINRCYFNISSLYVYSTNLLIRLFSMSKMEIKCTIALSKLSET